MNAPAFARAAMLLGFMLAVAGTHAQSVPSIVGLVLDVSSDVPLAGATVVIPGTLYGTETGSDGTFVFNLIEAGSYELAVSAVGYHTLRQVVTVAADTVLEVRLALRRRAAPIPEFSPVVAGYQVRVHELQAALQRLPGLLPGRRSGIDFAYLLRGLQAAIYVDGVRMLEADRVLLAADQVNMAHLAGGPVALDRGLGGMHLIRSRPALSSTEFAYDSRTRGVRTTITLNRTKVRGYGNIQGIYHAVQNYTDGSGNLQAAEESAGCLDTWGQLDLGRGHQVYGRAAMEYRRRPVHRALERQNLFVRYTYADNQRVLRNLTVQTSWQRVAGFVEARQHSARMAVRLAPARTWQVSTGSDYYALPETRTHEAGAFIRFAHASDRVAIAAVGRFDHIGQDRSNVQYWSAEAAGKWTVSRTWALMAGGGRSTAIRSNTIIRQILHQVDLGTTWRAATLRAYVRSLGEDQLSGLDLYAQLSLPRGAGKMKISATLINDTTLPPAWGGLELIVTAPARLAQLGIYTFGVLQSDQWTAWFTGDMWLQVQLPRTMALRLAITNVLNRTYAWPMSHTAPTGILAEPGRSFMISLRYGR